MSSSAFLMTNPSSHYIHPSQPSSSSSHSNPPASVSHQHPLLLSPASSRAAFFEQEQAKQELKEQSKKDKLHSGLNSGGGGHERTPALEDALSLIKKKSSSRPSSLMGDTSSDSGSIKSRNSFESSQEQIQNEDENRHRNGVFQHSIQPGDTLEGICVMYNVKSDQVKRMNRLWTNDSIHLRKTLDIPAPLSSSSSVLKNRPSSSQSGQYRKSPSSSIRSITVLTRPPEVFTSLRAASSSEHLIHFTQKQKKSSSAHHAKHFSYPLDWSSPERLADTSSQHPFLPPPLQSQSRSPSPPTTRDSKTSPTSPPLSTKELLERIDYDVASIVAALKESAIETSPHQRSSPTSVSPTSSMKRLHLLTDLKCKTTRVSISPIEPESQSAFVSSQAPLRVVFTLTPLLGLLPEEVQETVKENVIHQLQRSLSQSFLKKLQIRPEEWVDMVTISKEQPDKAWTV